MPSWTERSARRFARWIAPAHMLLVLVMVFGLHHTEIFPLFSWTLFVAVRDEVSHARVEIAEVDGAAITPRSLMTFGFSDIERVQAFMLIQQIAAMPESDGLRTAHIRLLEGAYISRVGRGVRYRIASETFDPLERWRAEHR